MDNSIFCAYDMFGLEWNTLGKKDYLLLVDWMKAQSNALLSTEEECRIDVDIEYGSATSSSYTFEEFLKHFSPSATYEKIKIRLFCNKLYISCLFSRYETEASIYASSKVLTAPELESITNDLRKYVEQLYQKYASIDVVIEQPLPLIIQVNDQNKPDETNATRSQSDTRKKFYKSGVFWAAAIVIVTAALWAIDRFILGK